MAEREVDPSLRGAMSLISVLGPIVSIEEADGYNPEGERCLSYVITVRPRVPVDLAGLREALERAGFYAAFSMRKRSRLLRICLWPSRGVG